MISFKSKKLWGGKVSVRSCIVEFAKKTGQVIEVTHNGLKMKINSASSYTCDNVPHIAQRTDKYIKAGKVYQLFDYEWKPIVENDEWTSSGKESLLSAWKKLKEAKQKTLFDK